MFIYPYYIQQMNDLIDLIRPALSLDYSFLPNIDFILDVMVPEVCSNFSWTSSFQKNISTLLKPFSIFSWNFPLVAHSVSGAWKPSSCLKKKQTSKGAFPQINLHDISRTFTERVCRKQKIGSPHFCREILFGEWTLKLWTVLWKMWTFCNPPKRSTVVLEEVIVLSMFVYLCLCLEFW